MFLSEASPSKGSTKKPKRVGRGPGSGHGKTACKGEKGQRSRSGHSLMAGFEGGQMPLKRRVPKRGFKIPSRVEFQVVNLEALSRFSAGAAVDAKALHRARLIASADRPVKVLGRGAVDRALEVTVDAFSASAREAIEKAGGKAQTRQP